MKRVVIGAILSLSIAIGPIFGEEKKGEPTIRLLLPPPQTLNWSKPVKCTGIVSAALFEEARDMQDFKDNKVSVYVKKGTERLKLWLEGDTLIVQSGDQKPDHYRVSGHLNGFLVAIHYGGFVPAAHSISVNEKNGFAVWSLNEPMFVPASEYPYVQSVYMQCGN